MKKEPPNWPGSEGIGKYFFTLIFGLVFWTVILFFLICIFCE